MKLKVLVVACVALLACNAHAAGLGDPEMNVAQRLVESSLNQEVPAGDPRVGKAREQLLLVVKATGEPEQAVAQSCIRNARYIFDVTKIRVSPLEVLEALVAHAPASKSMSVSTNRYFELRAKQKLDHAAALAALK